MKLILGLVVFSLVGCASGLKSGSPSSEVLLGTVQKVQAATQKSFKSLGFEVVSQDDRCIRGTKPREMGFWVSSGGESVSVCLSAIDSKVKVEVQTEKSVFGFLGQKNWNARFLDEIKKAAGGS